MRIYNFVYSDGVYLLRSDVFVKTKKSSLKLSGLITPVFVLQFHNWKIFEYSHLSFISK